MKSFLLTPLAPARALRPSPWTCPRCVQYLPTAAFRPSNNILNLRRSLNTAALPKPKRRLHKLLVLASTVALLSAGGLVYQDKVRHYYAAARRSGRVVTCLALCINEYDLFWSPIIETTLTIIPVTASP